MERVRGGHSQVAHLDDGLDPGLSELSARASGTPRLAGTTTSAGRRSRLAGPHSASALSLKSSHGIASVSIPERAASHSNTVSRRIARTLACTHEARIRFHAPDAYVEATMPDG